MLRWVAARVRSQSCLRQADTKMWIPGNGLHQFFEKSDCFRRMAGTHQESRCSILGFKRIADYQGHPPQQCNSARKIARLDANVREPEHISRCRVVTFNFTGEADLQDLASRLLVARLLKLSGRLA